VRLPGSLKTLFMLLALAMLGEGFSTAPVLAANTPTTNTPTTNTPATKAPAPVPAANANAPESATVAQAASATDVQHPVPGQRNPRYKICRDDVLSLMFPIAPEFDQETVTVMPDGYVSLQGVGSVYLLGLTVPEAVETIRKAYATILRDPIIEVDLMDFQKAYFVALGQVQKPGRYDLRYDMTVTQAVAVAGGFSPEAKTQLFLFHQISPTTVEVKKLNIKEILNGKNVNEEMHLSPGDTIFVPEKAITKFRKYVPYSLTAGFYPTSAF